MGNIVWLASYPKSGNTWLRAFIYNLIEDNHRPGLISALPDYFESESKPYWYEKYVGAASSFEQVMSVRTKVHRDIAQSRDGSVFTKTHSQLSHYNGHPLHNMDVTAAAIYIVRNPLDVVISMADHFGLGIDEAIEFMGDPNTAAPGSVEDVASYLGSWSAHVESWTRASNNQFLVLKYEDMLDKPVREFSKVAKLLHLNKDKQRIKRAVNYSEFRQLKKQESVDGFIERSPDSSAFFRKGKKNQWVETLGEQQIKRIIELNYQQMLRFGYIPPRFR